MMRSIDLDQLAEMGSPLTPLPVFLHLTLLVGDFSFIQP